MAKDHSWPMHSVIARFLHRAYLCGHAELPHKSLEEIRRYYLQYPLPTLNKVTYQEMDVSGVRLRLHRLPIKRPSPLVIYLRASAYVLGSIKDTDFFCYYLSRYLKCIVVAIEPRISPESKFPTPFNDCLTGIHYLYDHHKTLGIDPKKMALWGESSGGNLACALSQFFRDEKLNIIQQQVLFYPMVDYSKQISYSSKQRYAQGYLMDNALCDWFLSQYVRSDWDYLDKRVSPVLADNFEGLPATLLIGAQYDPMRDEAFLYLEKLVKSNVRAQGLCMPGMIHGFLWFTRKLETPRVAQRLAADFLAENFL